jgi:hypothetical protein
LRGHADFLFLLASIPKRQRKNLSFERSFRAKG